jgi:hypothetical protein
VEKICEKAGPKARKIFLDLEGMQRREWVKLKRIRMDFLNEDGVLVTRAVTDKDFSGFYHAAHDYHLWRTSREYIAPEWENVELILEDEALIKWCAKSQAGKVCRSKTTTRSRRRGSPRRERLFKK